MPDKEPETDKYEPTVQERDAARRYLRRKAERPPAAKFKVVAKGNNVTISADHRDPAINAALLAETLAISDLRVADVLLDQIAHIARTGSELKESELNGMLAMVHALGPRDATEALLVVQMIAIHNAVTVAARRLAQVETLPQQDSASTMLNKLARTFAAQIEALKRYRATGEQNIKVQHVTVAPGAQAIVGNVHAGGGAPQKTGDQPHELGEFAETSPPDARSTPLLGQEQAHGMPLPCPCSPTLERMPISRSAGRCTEGEG